MAFFLAAGFFLAAFFLVAAFLAVLAGLVGFLRELFFTDLGAVFGAGFRRVGFFAGFFLAIPSSDGPKFVRIYLAASTLARRIGYASRPNRSAARPS